MTLSTDPEGGGKAGGGADIGEGGDSTEEGRKGNWEG